MNEKNIVFESEFENVSLFEEHLYIQSKKDRICILPYTISEDGLLDQMGVIEIWNEEEEGASQTLVTDYLNEDDNTNLVGANRLLYEITGINLTDASKWMYLGSLFIHLYSDSPLRVYAADISGTSLQTGVVKEEERKHFKLIDSSLVAQSDDLLFLGAFTRLFNYFYVKALK